MFISSLTNDDIGKIYLQTYNANNYKRPLEYIGDIANVNGNFKQFKMLHQKSPIFSFSSNDTSFQLQQLSVPKDVASHIGSYIGNFGGKKRKTNRRKTNRRKTNRRKQYKNRDK